MQIKILAMTIALFSFVGMGQMAIASDVTVGDITIANPTIKKANKGMSTGAFMVIENTGKQSDVLVSVHSDIAKRTEVHLTSISKDGMAKMEHQKDGVQIPAGGSLVFKHGSYHIMFMGLTGDVKHHPVPFQLVFKNAGTVTVHAKVVSPTMKKHKHK